MSRPRQNDDGSLSFPRRGPPPIATSNWSPDPNDPYRLIPCFSDCKHRSYEYRTLPCGKIVGRWVCNYYNKDVTFTDCRNCRIPLL